LNYKNAKIRLDFHFIHTTKADTGKRTSPIDLAHQNRPSMFLEDVLIVVGGLSSQDLKKTAKSMSRNLFSRPEVLWQNE
jgi:hypothetical protein